jgi:acyl-CoA synthetase (AMP-forming)/AMP-acid ligase II/3-oxoacyl-(acyl-carrier-protein) synthase/thioesterase domain-containing protein/aryl carrier-like protein
MEDRLDWRCDLGDAIALVHGEYQWSHHDLHQESLRLVTALRELDVDPGSHVVVVLPNSAAAAVAHRGILLAGCAVVPLSKTSPADLAERIADHAEAAAILTPPGFWADALGPHEKKLELAGMPVIVRRRSSGSQSGQGASPLSYILYSSGTTGEPKGVAEGLDMTPAIRPISPSIIGKVTIGGALPFSHGMGRAALFQMWAGCKLVLIEPFSVEEFLRAADVHKMMNVSLVPAMAESLLHQEVDPNLNLSSLQHVMVGGAPVRPELVSRLNEVLGIRINVGYGLTEGGYVSTAWKGKIGSVGRRRSLQSDLRIVGEDKAVVPDGTVGEIQFRSHKGQYYYKNPEATSATFESGWVRTGDLGYFDSDGDLFLVGRVKEMIIQGGVNVMPDEIESVISQIAGIKECSVLGIPDESLGERVVAFIVADSEGAPTEEDVIASCLSKLDEHKVPATMEFVESLPKTELGKVRKGVLREAFMAQEARTSPLPEQLRSVRNSERAGFIRQAILSQVRKILRTEEVDQDRPLGLLGMTSFGMVRLAREIGLLTGKFVPATVCFNYSTVAALADYVMKESGVDDEPAVLVSDKPRLNHEPIAIVGMGCRFPGGADSPEKFWDLLERGTDCIQEIPVSRWNMEPVFDPTPGTPGKTYVRSAALLERSSPFEARHFGISPAEARKMSEAEKLALEVVRDTLESGGYSKHQDLGTVGLFLGAMEQGGAISGGISYYFNLDGPNVAIDAQCASSLVAVHTAVQSLRNRESDAALAGGVFVFKGPGSFVGPSQMRLLSKGARSRTFDADADGIGMGEGCGFVLLKRLSDVKPVEETVMAVIRGSAINHGGRSSSPTAPNGRAVGTVIRKALLDSSTEPTQIGYIETHGTGTRLGDPVEVAAIDEILGRERTEALVLGAVKTNIGHLHAAAGIAGLIKAVLSVRKGVIPRNVHFRRLNPLLEPFSKNLLFPSNTLHWPSDRRRIAGVTSLGLSGVNAHVIIEEAVTRLPAVAPAAAPDGEVVLESASETLSPTTVARGISASFEDLLQSLRTALADIVDCAPAEIGIEDNLFDVGLNSLRLLDFLDEVYRIAGVQCEPSEFMSRPRLGDFTRYLCRSVPGERSRLVAFQKQGSLPPLFCMHPAGGDVTVYARLAALLGKEQPTFAIPSPEDDEGWSLNKRAIHYADLIEACRQEGAVHLLGWSMGAVVAQAVASELEHRNRTVHRVWMIDPPRLGASDSFESNENKEVMAVLGAICAVNPAANLAGFMTQLIGMEAEHILPWCEKNELLAPGRITGEEFSSLIEKRRAHIRSLEGCEPSRCSAPLTIWWAGRADGGIWSRHSLSGAEERVMPATHFTIVQGNSMAEIARDIQKEEGRGSN